ncbi:MAG TPA: winged helix DNA-binding domain-containing protein [Acidimicrobiia bacterium]|nr:winged helix DNA-binding domain-containing protein [Acidimicrobiia bacterium]
MRSVTISERRARLGVRHHLAGDYKADIVEAAAGRMVGFHASDPASVYLAARARVQGVTVEHLERALYEGRSMLRILGMRRTMFAAPLELAQLIQAGAASRLIAGERKRMAGFLAAGGVTDEPVAWLKEMEEATFAALEESGPALAQELTKKVPGLSEQISFGEGTKWAGTMGVSTRVLFLLALDGRIGRGRPRGTWTSSQHRWAPIDYWTPGGLGEVDPSEARRQIIRRWLFTFGPGGMDDIRWWTGWTVAEIRHALAEVDVTEVDVDGQVALLLSDDLDPVNPPGSWVAFLPGLDPTPMGWKERAWYLGLHKAALFDRNGNIGPSIWHDGRIIGGWGQNQERKVVYRILEPVSSRVARDAAREAAAVEEWIGDTKVTPRFRTPLEAELAR